MDLERRIIELAERRGLIPSGRYPEDTQDVQISPEQTTTWGMCLDRLIELGVLQEDQVKSLALEAMQAEATLQKNQDAVCPDSWLMDSEVPSGELIRFDKDRLGLGRYENLVLLGVGGTAQVFSAFDKVLQRQVALKFLRGDSHQNRASILREARAQAQVEHINICKVFEVGESEDRPYIAMQLVHGQTLTQVRGTLSFRQKISVVRDVAEAIHSAHRAGLIHLDIKPGNILMESLEEGQWRPLVTDFGLYLSSSAGAEEVRSQRWIPLGTPPYSSPEQLNEAWEELDQRSDVYSLGVVLYSLLAGALPYESTNPREVRKSILNRDLIPLSQRVKGISKDLDAIVRCAMATNKQQRYGSALAMAEDLDRFLRNEPVLARPQNLLGRLGKWAHRNKSLAATALIALAILASWTWWYSYRARKWAQLSASYSQYLRDTQYATADVFKPLHDTRRSRDGALRTALSLEQMLKTSGALSRPPLHLTLGKIYLELGSLEQTQRHLEQAEALGFAGEDTDSYLCIALMQRYFLAVSDATFLSPTERKVKLLDSDRRFRTPALRRINKLLSKHPTDEDWPMFKAILEDRLEEAERLQKARALKDPSMGAYGGLVVLGLNQLISREQAERDPGSVRSALKNRKAFTEMVIEATPSQAAAYAALADCNRIQAKLFEAHTLEGERLLREAVVQAERGLVTEPDNPEVTLALASALQALAENLKSRDLDPAVVRLRTAKVAQETLDLLPKWESFYGPETTQNLRRESEKILKETQG